MARIFSDVVDAPLDEVFAWHAQPGAFARLAPPWVPARLVAEAASLRDGRAVLALPGGLAWVARHDPAAYDPPQRFADELVSLPLSALVPWRHVHEFAEAGPARTRVTDRVFTPVPAALLRPMFGYRHRQLAEIGAAGRLGTGRQWLSWIGIDDLTDIYYRALVDGRLAGPVNATAPHPVRNAGYAHVLGQVLHRPVQLPIPAIGPRLLLGGEGAGELAEASQRVSPQRLLAVGHPFRHPELEPALRHLLGRTKLAANTTG